MGYQKLFIPERQAQGKNAADVRENTSGDQKRNT